MVTSLYFLAASLSNSELFSLVVRQKISALTGGCFFSTGSSLVTLASALHLFTTDHLRRMDSVNLKQSLLAYINFCITEVRPDVKF